MRPIHPLDLAEILDAVPLDDEACVRLRAAFVSKIGLDEATIEAKVGIIAVMPVAFAGSRFDIRMRGVGSETAFVIGDVDEMEAIVDLVAWPVRRPEVMATFGGHTSMLGLPQLRAHPPTIFSPPLPVHRTAARWLRAGCIGVVPIDQLRSARAFIEASGQILAEDDQHGSALAAARQELVARAPEIVVAERLARAAA